MPSTSAVEVRTAALRLGGIVVADDLSGHTGPKTVERIEAAEASLH